AFVLGLLTRILKTGHNDVTSVAHLPLPSVGPPVVEDGDLKNQSGIFRMLVERGWIKFLNHVSLPCLANAPLFESFHRTRRKRKTRRREPARLPLIVRMM